VELFARDRVFWRLVMHAAVIGLLAGAAAWIFTRVVKLGTEAIWGEDITYDFMGGEWWWLVVTGGAGLMVGWLRHWLKVPEDPTGSLAAIQEARVDHRTALQTVAVSAVSLIGGASLGPFDAATRSGGGIGSWLSTRLDLPEEMKRINTLSGINGSIGGMLTAPVLATLFVSELHRPDPDRYYRVLIPNLVGSIFGFFVMFSLAGDTFLGVFSVPTFDVEIWHFAVAVLLGVVAAAISWLLGATLYVVRGVAVRIKAHSIVLSTAGGLAFGLIGIALPLTLASGKEQLSVSLDQVDEIGAGLMVAVVLGKILAMSIALGTGFVGGPVMPSLFIGGAAGIAVHVMVPDLPLGLAFSAMLVAVPGASVKAPFSMVLLATLTAGVGPANAAPAAVAVIAAYLATSGLGLFGMRTGESADPDDDHQVVFRDQLFDIAEPATPSDDPPSTSGGRE
jgi:H+/Cl- antiporter ClcA